MAEKTKIIKHKVKVLDEEGNPIRNEKGRFKWKVVEKTYRIDADFVPTAIEDICIDFIDNYVDANNEGEWLVSELEKTEVYKKGKKQGEEKDISFVSLRAAFTKKFFPDIIKGSDKKEESFRTKLLAKYSKKN